MIAAIVCVQGETGKSYLTGLFADGSTMTVMPCNASIASYSPELGVDSYWIETNQPISIASLIATGTQVMDTRIILDYN